MEANRERLNEGGLYEADMIGQRKDGLADLRATHPDEGGHGAVRSAPTYKAMIGVNGDAHSDGHSLHSRADGGDRAGKFMADGQGLLQRLDATEASLRDIAEVAAANTAGGYPDDYFARSGGARSPRPIERRPDHVRGRAAL